MNPTNRGRKEGYLLKKSQLGFSWNQRWVVVAQGLFHFANTSSDPAPKQSLSLQGAAVTLVESAATLNRYPFQVAFQDESRTAMTFATTTAQECQEWVIFIEDEIQSFVMRARSPSGNFSPVAVPVQAAAAADSAAASSSDSLPPLPLVPAVDSIPPGPEPASAPVADAASKPVAEDGEVKDGLFFVLKLLGILVVCANVLCCL